ncbi:hypothetical protein [Streptomyces antimycoticus]|uniref:hypothetical protein n=1 Tax=Streptomyces antimycoticus TaxID=68175 RepID=UPI00191BC60B|nr:hypothetical protein [Streptomyces antimycoticus]
MHGAYRVLTADGRISAGFRWPDGQRREDPRTLLEAEGVVFDSANRARRSHRLTTTDLATLLGKDLAEEAPPTQDGDTEERTAADRFEAQLRENQAPETVEGVLAMLRFWEQQGGHRAFGRAAETSCSPVLRVGGQLDSRTLWPLAIYPVTGTVEVVFQYLKRRPPFDDEPLRRELMARLNEIEGIDLAEAKLDLRPSFPVEVFADHSEEICAALEWFVHTVALAEARRPMPMDDEPDIA